MGDAGVWNCWFSGFNLGLILVQSWFNFGNSGLCPDGARITLARMEPGFGLTKIKTIKVFDLNTENNV